MKKKRIDSQHQAGLILKKAKLKFEHTSSLDLALHHQRYFKTELECYGIPKKQIHAFAKQFYREHKALPQTRFIGELQQLWRSDIHELRTLAIGIANLFVVEKQPLLKNYPFEIWLNQCHTWDHTDELCIRVIGLVQTYDSNFRKQRELWAVAPHKWTKRASLISQLPEIRKNKADPLLIKKICSSLAAENDFFIRKAIGWTLREFSKVDPESAKKILFELEPYLSPLSIREALRKPSNNAAPP